MSPSIHVGSPSNTQALARVLSKLTPAVFLCPCCVSAWFPPVPLLPGSFPSHLQPCVDLCVSLSLWAAHRGTASLDPPALMVPWVPALDSQPDSETQPTSPCLELGFWEGSAKNHGWM